MKFSDKNMRNSLTFNFAKSNLYSKYQSIEVKQSNEKVTNSH